MAPARVPNLRPASAAAPRAACQAASTAWLLVSVPSRGSCLRRTSPRPLHRLILIQFQRREQHPPARVEFPHRMVAGEDLALLDPDRGAADIGAEPAEPLMRHGSPPLGS